MNISVFYALIAFSALIVGAALLIIILKPLIFPLLWAVIIGMAAQPLHHRIKKKVKGDILSALVTTAILTLIILLPFIILVEMLSIEAIQAYNIFQEWFEKGIYPPLELFKSYPLGKTIWQNMNYFLSHFGTTTKPVLLSLSKRIAEFVLEHSGEVIKNIFVFIIKFAFMVIALFFLFKDGAKWGHLIIEIIPLEKKQIDTLRIKFHQMIYAVLYGILLTGLVQGTLAGIGYAVAGVNSPVLLGAATAIFSLVPLIGSTIIWVPVVGYLFLKGDTAHGITLGLWCLLIVSTIDNMIRPFFISGKSRTPLFLTIIGVFGGLSAFGFIGIILGPLILVICSTLFEFYLEYGKTQNSLPVDE
ncbi:MAG: AI-2E family transporter [Nitrospinae bacterium]|nr:AI-2E family transporter [Nitrospinota bacterium]